MTEFRNAYQFVPRAALKKENSRKLPARQVDYGLGEAAIADGHAAYAPGTHSGRIRCRVTLECPTVIGARRISGEKRQTHSLVLPFLFRNRPAIPATSLKGVISSVAESAAAAPYRVLPDMNLTVSYYQPQTRSSVRHSTGDGNAATQMGSSHDYFDPDLLPLTIHPKGTPGRVTRSEVNPVEAMFGFVREMAVKKAESGKDSVVAAAGKLRFSHALLSPDEPERDLKDYFLRGDYPGPDGAPAGLRFTRLKEQSQPMKQYVPADGDPLRSATPNFYFVEHANPAAFIEKKTFAERKPSDYRAQGGKFYLHHPDAATGEPWKTADTSRNNADLERKAAVAPLRRGLTFDFHVDFDNLSGRELDLLCFALRPTERFRHKIGLGKALGLGSIRIDITDLVLIDRAARYSGATLFEEDPRSRPAPPTSADEARARAKEHLDWLAGNDKAAHRALLAIGETHRFDGVEDTDAAVPVLWVPLTTEKLDGLSSGDSSRRLAAEDESFKWFVLNEKHEHRQKLRPIGNGPIPTLRTLATPPKRSGGGSERRKDDGHRQSDARVPAQNVGPARLGVIFNVKRNSDGTHRAWVRASDVGTSHMVNETLCRRMAIDEGSKSKRVMFELFPPSDKDNGFQPSVRSLIIL